MSREDQAGSLQPQGSATASPDAQLVQQLRQGDAEAGRRLVRDYYPGVYRYLLYLTGRREAAEDLTQETFVQAWRRLETFDNRGPLKPWLHRIAHREFLQALRSRHDEASLDQIPEAAAPSIEGPASEVELRAVMARLPLEAREVIALHHLEGYSYQEIARIVDAPVSTVKFRLAGARAALLRELGEGDLSYLNGVPEALARRWSWLPLEALITLEARLAWKGEHPMSEITSSGMSRRKLLEAAGTAAAAAAAARLGSPAAAPNEAEVIDERLTRKVALASKATALADLCEQLRGETGIEIAAGPSVADEKVTLFCPATPLREVMRQLSRPFGYTWLRSGTPGKYRYELVQELRSQLLEEELRNRDRSAAFIALEQEIQRYRPYLELSPDEALARARTAPAGEKSLLEKIGRSGWGAIQMYFRLTPQQQTALRDGQELRFSQAPKPGELPLPADVAHGILQSLRDVFYYRYPDGFGLSTGVTEPKEGDLPPTAVPEARATVNLLVRPTELGRIALKYSAGTFSRSDLPRNSGGGTMEGDGSLAVGDSPVVDRPNNRVVNAKLAGEPALHRRISVSPEGSCGDCGFWISDFGLPAKADGSNRAEPLTSSDQSKIQNPKSKIMSADVLEALHRATGMPIVADFYTRLYSPAALAVHDRPIFDVLNLLADGMHMRWNKDADWLQFRSTSYYDDRLKEVPNRLLTRWETARRRHAGELRFGRDSGQQRGPGPGLTLDDLCEIAQLSDVQLDADSMAEGAQACYGLAEWRLVASRIHRLRPHLRFLAELTPEQRREAMSPAGLAFTRMSLPQQQRYIALALRFDDQPLQSLEELSGAIMREVYTRTGEYEWLPPGPNWYQWVVPIVAGEQGSREVIPPVVAPTKEAALAAARRIDARHLEAILPEAQRLHPELRTAADVPAAGELKPTDLDVTIVYVLGLSNRRNISVVSTHADYHNSTW